MSDVTSEAPKWVAPVPDWVILEGIWYRRSDERPETPPWTHVTRAHRPASDIPVLPEDS